MDAKELIRNWPEFAKANAARILASPAWRLETCYDGKPAAVKRACEDTDAGRISLSVRFDDEPRTVTFAPSPLFPDLWVLRDRLGALPPEVLLALVEKECGSLFQFFEDVSRQSFSIGGLSDEPATGCAFKLETEDGEVVYTVDLSPMMEQHLGQISNLDVTHESIRSLTREATAVHAVLEMSDAEVATLAAGDCLVLPPGAAPAWEIELPSDGFLRLVASEKRMVTFAEIADGTLGPVPPVEKVDVVFKGRVLATGVFATLGEARAVRIENVS